VHRGKLVGGHPIARKSAGLDCGLRFGQSSLLHDGPVKAFRVVHKELLAEALHGWAASVRWENDFAERNRTFLANRQ
jgi:hypothetical protein